MRENHDKDTERGKGKKAKGERLRLLPKGKEKEAKMSKGNKKGDSETLYLLLFAGQTGGKAPDAQTREEPSSACDGVVARLSAQKKKKMLWVAPSISGNSSCIRSKI